MYNVHVKRFSWNEEKNKKLKEERGRSFEDVVDCFTNGNFYGVYENPSGNFPHQEVFLVCIKNYPCIVPFIEDNEEVFLKTIIPDRRFKKFIEEKK